MKKFLFSIFVLSFLIVACGTNQTPSVLAVAPPPQVASNYCAAAETHLKTLGCISITAPYTLKGKNFTEFCQETQSNGIDLGPQCLSTITSCNQMDSCAGTTKGNK